MPFSVWKVWLCEMRTADETIHHRRIFTYFSEVDLVAILSKKIAEENDFVIDGRKTKISAIFSKKDKGQAGFETYCELTMVNELDT